MVDPAVALLVFALIVALLAVVFWPKRGIVARLARAARVNERVRIEDAVKYMYHAGEDGAPVRPEALAGALSVGVNTARELLTRLTSLDLAEARGAGFVLTENGRTDALRLVRTHRLVERWLADHTGVDPREWHAVAEKAEHVMTVAETERLASRLGHPRYDPHGDPIPTASGELPRDRHELLSALEPGEAGVVVHLEDEPEDAFDAVRATGLALGKQLVVLDRDTNKVTLELEGGAVSMPRVLEPAVNVLRRPRQEWVKQRTLADLEPGESAVVAGIDLACGGAQRRRLLDLGVVPGTRITALMRSAGGDPIAYDIRGAMIGLRRQQAEWIVLAPDEKNATANGTHSEGRVA